MREMQKVSTHKKISSNQWHETALMLVSRSVDNVHCPECGKLSLSVRDMEYGCGTTKGIQRYIGCSACGAFQVINLKRAGSHAVA